MILLLVFMVIFLFSFSVYAQETLKTKEVVITATKTEAETEDLPVVVEIITQEEIKQKNAKTAQDAIKQIPGIKVMKNVSHWGEKGRIQIWGLDPKHTLILLDGQRLLGGHGDAVDLQQISVDMIERIEIVKGPASALYGSEAIGGVINIITKNAPEKTTASISAGAGNRGTRVLEVGGGFRIDNFGTYLSFTRRDSKGVKKEFDEYTENIFHGKLNYKLSDNIELKLSPFYSEQKMEYEKRKQERLSINSTFEWRPDKITKLSLRGSLMKYKNYTSNKSSDWDNDSQEIEFIASRLFFDRHLITLGYQLSREDIDDRGKRYSADQTTHGIYIQDEMDYSPFILIIGARLDRHDRWGTEFNPKASILYKVIENLKIRGSVGTAFKAPSLVRLYGDRWRMGPYLVIANPDLKPEESVGYQLGIDWNLLKGYKASFTLFRNDLKNLISYYYRRVGPPPWNLYWINVDRAKTQGVEISVDGEIIKNLNFKVGYTLLDTEDKNTGKELTLRPKNSVMVELNYRISELGLNLNLSGDYVGKRYEDAANTVRLGGYTIYNLSASWEPWKHTRLFGRIDNLTGKRNIKDEYDIDGRVYLVGLELKF